MPKRNRNITWLPKTEEDQKALDQLKLVKLSLVDRAHIERFINQLTSSAQITEGQRGLIKKLQHKYRKQISDGSEQLVLRRVK